MKTVLCVIVAAVVSAITLAAEAAPAPTPAPVKAPAPTPSASSAPGVNPAVQASQNAAVPGDLRPENPVVPQVKIPIGRAASVPANNSVTRGGIDDRAARCQARVSAEARAACMARPAAQPAR